MAKWLEDEHREGQSPGSWFRVYPVLASSSPSLRGALRENTDAAACPGASSARRGTEALRFQQEVEWEGCLQTVKYQACYGVLRISSRRLRPTRLSPPPAKCCVSHTGGCARGVCVCTCTPARPPVGAVSPSPGGSSQSSLPACEIFGCLLSGVGFSPRSLLGALCWPRKDLLLTMLPSCSVWPSSYGWHVPPGSGLGRQFGAPPVSLHKVGCRPRGISLTLRKLALPRGSRSSFTW